MVDIGFIGLGAMGLPMATQIVAAGHAVHGFDVRRDAVDALVAAGGHAAATPRDAAAGRALLVLMVATAEQVDAALADGALDALASGATVVLHSTVPPAYTRELAQRVHAHGHEFVDAPVSGGVVGAETGNLTVMASGSDAAFAAAQPELDAVAGKLYRLGDEPGVGSTVKLVNQHLAGVHIASAAEAMALGVRAGADPRVLYDVISNSAGNSWMFTNRVPHMLDDDFTPRSALEIFVKDLGIVLDTGRALRFPLPIAATAHQQFLAGAAAGHGREDDAAVVKVYEQLAGISVAAPPPAPE
jgi:3-hydroxyisobutyrate dehydrogenase